jgi:hypothetical protein
MSILVWPFAALWRLVSLIFEATGRFVAVILGLVFLAVGALLSASVVLACLGAPLMILGVLLIVRGLF